VQGLGDDTGTRGQTNSGLDTNDRVSLGRVDDTAISLSSEGDGNQVGTNSNTGTSATTTGVDSEVVSTTALTTAGSEALRVVVGAHVSPLAESTLAKKQSTGLTEAIDDVRVTGNNTAKQSPATSSGLHAVLAGNVVLDDEGNTVERTTNLAPRTLGIELLGNRKSIRVELQDSAGVRSDI
jgi:hypothetical protein